jgi:L-ascorbate metabolism protein UlaG (beta-lactamase superfamily)
MRWQNKFLPVLILGVLFLTGCPKVTKVVTPPMPPTGPVGPAKIEKTFGEVTYGGLATLIIQYKDIVLLVDPVFEGVGLLGNVKSKLDTLRTPGQIQRTQAPALTMEGLPHVDYLLLTDSQPHHLGEKARKGLRKDLKIIASNEAVEALKKDGFTQSKGLSQVQRIMLKKNDAFLFVTVVQARNPANGELVNGYLLEFDNGRNLFISGEIVDEAVIRQFVYMLRDDGKQIDLAFMYGGGLRTMTDKVWQSAGEDMCANFIGIIQPRVAYVVQAEGLDVASFDAAILKTKLQDQIFSGEMTVLKPGDKIPF